MKTGGRSPPLLPPSPPLPINRNNLEASARLRLLLPPPPPPLPFSPLARRRLAATRIGAAPRPQQRSPPPRAERPRRPHHHWCGMAEVAAGTGQLIGVAVATLLAAIFLAAALLGSRRRRRRAPLAGKPAAVGGCGVADGEGCGGDGRTDVIVVGAGVAGSALAYTLGKVTPSRLLSSLEFSHWFGGGTFGFLDGFFFFLNLQICCLRFVENRVIQKKRLKNTARLNIFFSGKLGARTNFSILKQSLKYKLPTPAYACVEL